MTLFIRLLASGCALLGLFCFTLVGVGLLAGSVSWLPLLAGLCLALIVAALLHRGGKWLQWPGYLAALTLLVLFVLLLQAPLALAPASHDAFGGLVVSSAGILLAGLALWGIYQAGRRSEKN
ncbi:hypothetical protein [Bacterioplanoides pacificum]|uniref:Uncharacterized protein n=1 Tax=Bacterioplanoides pacificum TaxID=1171596 RepID=A0ABV7VVF1_9GAMM